jgi:hypothetical protein
MMRLSSWQLNQIRQKGVFVTGLLQIQFTEAAQALIQISIKKQDKVEKYVFITFKSKF